MRLETSTESVSRLFRIDGSAESSSASTSIRCAMNVIALFCRSVDDSKSNSRAESAATKYHSRLEHLGQAISPNNMLGSTRISVLQLGQQLVVNSVSCEGLFMGLVYRWAASALFSMDLLTLPVKFRQIPY